MNMYIGKKKSWRFILQNVKSHLSPAWESRMVSGFPSLFHFFSFPLISLSFLNGECVFLLLKDFMRAVPDAQQR